MCCSWDRDSEKERWWGEGGGRAPVESPEALSAESDGPGPIMFGARRVCQ